MQRAAQNLMIGKEPTTAQKLAHVANKLGIPGIAGMQGAAVNIFDTQLIATNAQSQTLTFFKNTSNKTRTFTNWQNGEFKAGETLGLDYVWIQLVQLLNTTLTDPANTITGSFPVGRNNASLILAYSMASFSIANVITFKNFQMIESIPAFNMENTGISAYDAAVITNPVIVGRTAVKLPASPVIPPNQGVEFQLEIPPITLPAGNWGVMVTLGRQGSIYSAKTSL